MPLSRLIGILYTVVGAIGLLLLYVVDPLRQSSFFQNDNILLATVALFFFLIVVGIIMAIPRRN